MDNLDRAVADPLPPAHRARSTGKRRKPKLFLSYRRSDSSDLCGRLRDRLSPVFGETRVVKDDVSFPPGVDFESYIRNVIPTCTHLIVLIGPNWVKSKSRRSKTFVDYVEVEVKCALENGVTVIPVLSGTNMPAMNKLPADLREIARKHAIPLRSDPDFHADVDRLIENLKSASPASQARKKRK